MNYQTYNIPANFTDAGKLFGLFTIRNGVEAVVIAAPMIYLCLRFLPFSITTKIMAAMMIGIPLGGFALIGVRDDCLTRFLAMWWRWRHGRGVITYRGALEQDRKRRRQAEPAPTRAHGFVAWKARHTRTGNDLKGGLI